MRIAVNIEEEDIERIARALDNQHAYTLAQNLEDSGYKRLADMFRGVLKRARTSLASIIGGSCDQIDPLEQPVRKKPER